MLERMAASLGILVGRGLKLLILISDDLLLVAGCICILYGLAKWNLPIAWIVGGMMLIGFGLLILIGRVKAMSGQKTTESAKEKSAE